MKATPIMRWQSLTMLLLIMFSAIGLPSIALGQAVPPLASADSGKPWICAYYLSGDADTGRLPATAIDFSALTHLIHFGVFPNADGTLGPVSGVIPESDSKTILTLAHAAGCKVLVCMATDEGAKHLRAAMTDAVRPTLVHNLVQFVVTRGYDGLDLDEEPLDDSDVATYSKFVPELRAALDAAKPGLLLTAAVASQPAMFAKLQSRFDRINLMTYDNSGPWPGHKTWYNASLYGAGSEKMNPTEVYPSVDETVQQYEAAGIPAAKLGIGVAFYGYIWNRVSGPKQSVQGLTAADINDGADFSLIMDQYYQPGRYHWDDQAKAPYLTIDAPDPKDRKFISYDDARLCGLKIDYVKQQKLGGVIIWELGGGYRAHQPPGQRDPLLQAVKKILDDAMKQSAAASAVLLSLFFTLLSGCGPNTEKDAGPVHVRVWSMWGGDEERDFEQVLAYYNRTHPTVVLENLGAVDDPKTVRAIVAAAPPDLCTLADPNSLGALAANNALQPLDARFRLADLKEDSYTPGSLSQCQYGGHLYALPYLLDCIALLYNKDVFQSAGLDPDKPPRTLEEMEADCQKITQHDAQGRLTRLGMRPPDAITLMGLYGGGFLDPTTGRITADNPRNLQAAAFDKKLMDMQGGYEAVQSFSQGFANDMGSYNPFFLGKIGMTFNGQWNTYWAYHYSPKTRYGIAPLPYPAAYPKQAGTVWLGGNLFCIPRGAKHAREAWDFLAWTQSPEGQRRFAMSLHGIPNLRASLRDPALRAGEPWRTAYGRFMDLSDSPNATHFPPMPVATQYQNELVNAVDGVCYGSRSPQEALAAVRIRVQHDLDAYR